MDENREEGNFFILLHTFLIEKEFFCYKHIQELLKGKNEN